MVVTAKHARARAGAEALANMVPRASPSPSPSAASLGSARPMSHTRQHRTGSAANSVASFNSISTSLSQSHSHSGASAGALSGGAGQGAPGVGGAVDWADVGAGGAEGVLTAMHLDEPVSTFPWKVGELLGRGRTGHVYKAMRSDTGELIAMKVP